MDRGDSIAWIAGESRYAHRLVELEHRGERASVWSAVEARGESLAVIKRVSTPTASTLRAWATLSAFTTSTLAEVHTYHADGDDAVVILEHLQGGTLRRLSEASNRMPWSEARRIGAALADALALIHRAKICVGPFDADQIGLRSASVPIEPVLLAARSVHPTYSPDEARRDVLSLIRLVAQLCDDGANDFRRTDNFGRLMQAQTLVEELPDPTEAANQLSELWRRNRSRRVTNDDPRVSLNKPTTNAALRAWIELIGDGAERSPPQVLWRQLGFDAAAPTGDLWRLTLPLLGEPKASLTEVVRQISQWQQRSGDAAARVHLSLKLLSQSTPTPEAVTRPAQGPPSDNTTLTVDSAVWRQVRGSHLGAWLQQDVVALLGETTADTLQSQTPLTLGDWMEPDLGRLKELLNDAMSRGESVNVVTLDGQDLWPVMRSCAFGLNLPPRSIALVADPGVRDITDLTATLVRSLAKRVTKGAEVGLYREWRELLATTLSDSHDAQRAANELAAVMVGVPVQQRLSDVSAALVQVLERLRIGSIVCFVHGELEGLMAWLKALQGASIEVMALTCNHPTLEPQRDLEPTMMDLQALSQRIKRRFPGVEDVDELVKVLYRLTFGHEASLQALEDELIAADLLQEQDGEWLLATNLSDWLSSGLSIWMQANINRTLLMQMALFTDGAPRWLVGVGTSPASLDSDLSVLESLALLRPPDDHGANTLQLKDGPLKRVLPTLAANPMRAIVERMVDAIMKVDHVPAAERATALKNLLRAPLPHSAHSMLCQRLMAELRRGEPTLAWLVFGEPLVAGQMYQGRTAAEERAEATIALWGAAQMGFSKAARQLLLRLDLRFLARHDPTSWQLSIWLESDPTRPGRESQVGRYERAWQQWCEVALTERAGLTCDEDEITTLVSLIGAAGAAEQSSDVPSPNLAIAYRQRAMASAGDAARQWLMRAFAATEMAPDAWFDSLLNHVAWLRLGFPAELSPIRRSLLLKSALTQLVLDVSREELKDHL